MNDKLNIDKSIREKLDGFSAAPPPHIWNNIQGEMLAQRKKKRMVYMGWISAAAVVVFAFIAGWFLNKQSVEITPTFVQKELVQPKDVGSKDLVRTDIDELSDSDALLAEKTKQNILNKKESAELITPSTAAELELENTFVASVERLSYDVLESIEAIFALEEGIAYLAKHKAKQQTEIKTISSDEVLIAQNIESFQNEKSKENGWIVGAHVSPGYSSQSANHDEQYAKKMTYTSNDGNGNIGGGLSVQYKTSKRLRVESGLYYSQNGQSSKNSIEGLFGFSAKNDYMYASPENVDAITAKPSFSNAVQLNNNGIAMNSAAGVINMRSTPKGASIATSAETLNSRDANTLTTNGEFSQEFEFVEVPFYLRYSVLDKKFGIEVIGGVNAGFVVGNNAYINNNYGKQNIGSTEDISTLNLSGTIGLGLNYMLGQHFSLAVEPRLNYFLNSINSNPDVDYRPYRIGVFTGVYYEF